MEGKIKMKIAYFDCFSGISGDMILGAVIDAGLDTEELQSELNKLAFSEYKIDFSKDIKQGISGTQFRVKSNHEHEESEQNHSKHKHHNKEHHEHFHHSHRKLSDILSLIEESELDSSVKERTSKIFHRLAEAEAKIHNKSKEEIHFHEVGAVDSIVDIVGASIGFHLLEIEEIYASPISLGRGFVKCVHGVMPVPAPATLELLSGIPVHQTKINKELTTPTGAAIITTVAKQFGTMPDMIIEKVGYGAGQRDLEEHPNLLRICIGKKNRNMM